VNPFSSVTLASDASAAPDEADYSTSESITLPGVTPSPLVEVQGKTDDGRPRCMVRHCIRPEVADGKKLCGAHWATRPDLRPRDGRRRAAPEAETTQP
jgi:hypothetical protein